ncbi:BnaC09g52640D [Brassica napus]|uniref:glycerophosphodiester phosphodiesterase n=1 Tax=Brassica napus TaxID=3708 RepID=A0A078J4J5_BRANA|nr:unnamed protein product [Brassica napus]CDY58867.1 BnaC09g52640D [Brassica napus]
MITYMQDNPSMFRLRASKFLLLYVLILSQFLSTQLLAQRSKSPWQTLTGEAPLIIARGGFSGMFPDSSVTAYSFVSATSVPDAVLWCDVQLTKDGVGISFPDVTMYKDSNVKMLTLNGKTLTFLTESLLRTGSPLTSPPKISKACSHDAFYAQHNLSMSRFLLSVSKTVIIDYLSSPELKFFRDIGSRFGKTGPKFVFRFLEKDEVEVSTNQTYGSLMTNLTFINMFASGVLVPKSYIWPVDEDQYLLPHTTFVQDAHKEGLQVYASGFANDFDLAYNYSYDPLAEYLSFMDNGNFSVDGVVSDFPLTASSAVVLLLQRKGIFFVISKNGASGDYPGCSDLAYSKAIEDGADIIDYAIQMSSDGIPFCLNSSNLLEGTNVFQSPFINRSSTVPEIAPHAGLYSFSLRWTEIKTLRLAMTHPYSLGFNLFRNPREKSSEKIVSLYDFLILANKSSSLVGVLISVENVAYLREKQGIDVVKEVLYAFKEAYYINATKRVMIQSSNNPVLVDFKKQSPYEIVYQVEKNVGDIVDSAIEEIKKFADAVVVSRLSVYSTRNFFLTGQTHLVEKLHKFNLPVYVKTFRNEFVSQPWDFFSDATVEINTYVAGAGVSGTITEFPLTAARYKRNRCLTRKDHPPYMPLVKPAGLLGFVNHDSPHPAFTADDVTEPPLPPVTFRTPPNIPGPLSTDEKAPNSKTRLTPPLLLPALAMALASLLLLSSLSIL